MINTSQCYTVLHFWSVIGVRGERVYDRWLVLLSGERGGWAMCMSVAVHNSSCLWQGILLNPQTLSQTRRVKLRRAFTDATSETVTFVKTVGDSLSLYLSLSCLASFVLPCTYTLSSYPSYTKTTPINSVLRERNLIQRLEQIQIGSTV